jgi:heme exporter protein B
MRTPSTLAFCRRLLRRQLVLAIRRPVEIGNPLLFFAMVVALFPLGLGPSPDKLASFAPGILWIIALLSNLLTSDTVFRSDFEDGSLEQLYSRPNPCTCRYWPISPHTGCSRECCSPSCHRCLP